jgi:hypothetical protein
MSTYNVQNTWRLSVGLYVRNNRYGFTFPCFWCRFLLQELEELRGFWSAPATVFFATFEPVWNV